TDIAGGEDPRHAGLEQVWLALEPPALRFRSEIGSREDVALLVAGHDAVEELRVRRGADEHEECRCLELGAFAMTLDDDGSESRLASGTGFAAELADRRLGAELDVRRARD